MFNNFLKAQDTCFKIPPIVKYYQWSIDVVSFDVYANWGYTTYLNMYVSSYIHSFYFCCVVFTRYKQIHRFWALSFDLMVETFIHYNIAIYFSNYKYIANISWFYITLDIIYYVVICAHLRNYYLLNLELSSVFHVWFISCHLNAYVRVNEFFVLTDDINLDTIAQRGRSAYFCVHWPKLMGTYKLDDGKI